MELDGKPSTSEVHSDLESALILYKTIISGPFSQLSTKFEREINNLGIIPKITDIDGNEHPQTLRQYLHYRSIEPIKTIGNFLIEQRQNQKPRSILDFESLRISRFPVNSHLPWKKTINHTKLLSTRALGGFIPEKRLHDLSMIEHSLNYQYRILGHIDKTYNIRFDRTGRYLITGSDDMVIKVWDLNSAMLRYSFRGHQNLVVDLDISFCNQFMASVGGDKIIRIWDLQKGSQAEVARYHSNTVVCLNFLPKVFGNRRWLVSFGNDCNIIFYDFDEETKIFNDRANIFNVRTAPGLKVLSGTFSFCGNWVAAGDSHGYVHLFCFNEGTYQMDTDFKCLPVQEKIDTLEWSNTSRAFLVCSSRYHAGRIWRYIDNNWHYIEFSPKVADDSVMSILNSTKLKYGFFMAIWTLDDSHIVASGNDFRIRVFDAFSGDQKYCFDGHTKEAYTLKYHPIHANVVVSTAHDGSIFIWDIEQGKVLKKFMNETSDGDGDVISSAILDCTFSNDGTVLATVDDLGRLTVYGYGGSDGYKTPKEQFFSNDYEATIMDDGSFPLDFITGLAPHLNNPPWLVDAQQVIHEERWQRRVPGREIDRDSLISPWLTRCVVPKLDAKLHQAWIENQKNLILDSELYLINSDSRLKSYRPIGTENSAPVRVPTTTRRRTQIPTFEEVLREQEDRIRQDNLFGYRSEDDADYDAGGASGEESQRNEDSESDTSDESYEGRDTPQEREQETITTSSGRRVRSTQNHQSYPSPTRKPRRSRRAAGEAVDDHPTEDDDTRDAPLHDSLEDLEMALSAPGPSSEIKMPSREKKKKSKDIKVQQQATFPLSMQFVLPKRFPYVAQLGDRVVYCKQGHIQYLDRVEQLGLYPVSAKMRPKADLKAEEFCIIDEIKYTRKPFRLTNLRLAQLNKHNERNNVVFNVKYHDLDDCPDFIILRQLYDNVVNNSLNEGDEMEAVIDGTWWTGTVQKRQACNEEYPTSHWNCLTIVWDNGDSETMSPWDCQAKSPGRKSNTPASQEEEVQLGRYIPTDEDWPGNERPLSNMEFHCERLIRALNNLSSLDTIEPFSYPVNLADFPTYAVSVDYCIDIQTVSERLKNRYYRRLQAVQHDIRYIAVAAEQFNEPSSTIVINSRRLVEALIRFTKDTFMDPDDIVKFFDSMFDLDPEEIIEYRPKNALTLTEEIVKLASNEQSSTVPKEAGWIRDARPILDTAFKQPCAKLFFDKDMTEDQSIAEVLTEYGDLKTVLAELHSFATPQEVLKKINDIVNACREALDSHRSRHSINQLISLVEQKMKSVVDEYARIVTHYGDPVKRNLRERVKKNKSVYQTRSNAQDAPSNSRMVPQPGFYSQLASGRVETRDEDLFDRPTRAMRRNVMANLSRASSREPAIERDNVRATRRRQTLTSTESESVSNTSPTLESDASEYMAESPPVQHARRAQRRHEELQQELRELQEDEEERLEARSSKRKRKRKRVSSDSEGDFSGDSKSTRSRRSLRITRGSTRSRIENSDDEERENISSYGRIRRTRRL